MRSSRLPDAFELVTHDDRRIALRPIGPSAQGWVCATAAKDECYRLIPIGRGAGNGSGVRECEDAPIERRQRFREWKLGEPTAPEWTRHPASRYLAPIVDEGQAQTTFDENASWYYVRYDAPHATTLTEKLAAQDLTARLDAIILVLYRMNGWWQDVRRGLVPFAADIVFDASMRPLLLPTPAWRYLDLGALLAEPSRMASFAPECLRGTCEADAGAGAAIDRFALGALALRAFRQAPAVADVETGLPRAVTGRIWQDLASRVPYWLQRVPAATEAEAAVKLLLAPDPKVRAAVDLLQIGRTLEECRRRMEPARAVRELLDRGRADEAYGLLQDILLADDSIAMLISAADVARRCHHPLDEVDMLERALARPDATSDLYRRQFEVLTSDEGRESLDRWLTLEPGLGDHIDKRLLRNLEILETTSPSFEWEERMVDHLRWRGKLVEATHFIYSRLFDRERRFLWWKFPMRFKYFRTLLQTGQQLSIAGREEQAKDYIRRAGEELRLVKDALLMAHREGRLLQEEREAYFEEANALEESFMATQSGRAS
jgi:hypothetical protein